MPLKATFFSAVINYQQIHGFRSTKNHAKSYTPEVASLTDDTNSVFCFSNRTANVRQNNRCVYTSDATLPTSKSLFAGHRNNTVRLSIRSFVTTRARV